MFTWKFWRQALERAVKTVAQSAISVIGVDVTTGVFNVSWPVVASIAGLAGIVSLLMSVASSGVNDSSSPSLVETR